MQDEESTINFIIDPDTDPSMSFEVDDFGLVRLTGTLDRETFPSYNLQVLAYDPNKLSLTATATLLASEIE